MSISDLKDKTWAISRMGSGSHLMAVLLAEVCLPFSFLSAHDTRATMHMEHETAAEELHDPATATRVGQIFSSLRDRSQSGRSAPRPPRGVRHGATRKRLSMGEIYDEAAGILRLPPVLFSHCAECLVCFTTADSVLSVCGADLSLARTRRRRCCGRWTPANSAG